ncbi:MAG: HAD family hydrolase [Deltaproteobacteria bacterium]|nr:MAG: HAD family hydrolase [Deltaproteobacteria bacterium]TMQ17752.1 MAG: HAD family hydrolase [Deltaproteobacteria bacterium]
MALRYVVLDFDGTCTQIEAAYGGFLASYCAILEDANAIARGGLATAWRAAIDEVRAASPNAGWTLFDAPSTAPAAADPYILASEATALLQRQREIADVPADAYKRAYLSNPAPWRPEVPEVLAALVERGLKVGFVSNSDRFAIEMRLGDLLHADRKLRSKLVVCGNAAKYRVAELPIGATGPGAAHRARFEELDGALRVDGVARPIYLRRGSYFEALCGLWSDLGARDFPAAETLVCGDVWELDLAMPRALGAAVHLLRRTPPFETYPYELAQLPARDVSKDLRGLVDHVDRLRKKR